MSITDVLIVGAGPTGLALAIWLTKLGVAVRIIDKAATLATTTRALAVQARTLELYSQIGGGVGEAVAARSAHLTGPNLWAGGAHRARLDFADVAVGMTAFPFIAILSQNEHEQLLIDRLAALGVEVERGTGLESFVEDVEAASVRAVLQKGHDDGGEKREICEARYVAGCDGAHSAVRRIIGMGFPGDTYEQVFYVADIEATGPAMNGELHLCLDSHDFLGIIPLAGKQCARLIGIVTPPSESSPAAPAPASTTPPPPPSPPSPPPHASTFEHVRGRAVDQMKLENIHVNWFTTYRAHHRVADHFRRGRAFLLGDAAHIHSPAGGQGMNTGIGDAVNLAWKIAAVLDNNAPDSLLDTYEEERSRFAKTLVDTTDRAFTFMTKRGWLAGLIRSTFVAYVMPVLFCFRAIRHRAFCGLSQFVLDYTGTALAGGGAAAGGGGTIRAGERVPWVKIGGQDNHDSLQHIEWQLHVYGTASEQLVAWCKGDNNGMRLTVFEWVAEYGSAGFIKDAAYLLRPDTYVALIDAEADPRNIEQYFLERQMCLSFK
ncbi:monooxygenase, FAD-binding protein [Beauveria bassiana ARSEF 2860]|uniref:Monooxygenase, FAD-binding protein n=1 Tax=Beauveria bassiana (strain ARSEF 2860) TaxID=655819 RepID=J5JQ76_BEAB2|nr:monooxygenase, FAD-binding protein [Beauveria bassiana ARSEF 2860]EJP65021.1 monooxygenase, FAD-binding protein [Beauveria bassiana ARSEF 2860]